MMQTVHGCIGHLDPYAFEMMQSQILDSKPMTNITLCHAEFSCQVAHYERLIDRVDASQTRNICDQSRKTREVWCSPHEVDDGASRDTHHVRCGESQASLRVRPC